MVIADLLFGQARLFGDAYAFHWVWAPYLISDLMLAALVAACGLWLACAVLGAVLLFSLPATALLYLDSCGLHREQRSAAWLIALVLATDWSFTKGFVAFRLAVPAFLLALWCMRRLRRRFSAAGYLGYLSVIALGYGLHLSATTFTAVALVITAGVALTVGRTRLKLELALAAPMLLLLLWQLVLSAHLHRSSGAAADYTWGTWAEKLHGIEVGIIRFQPSTDVALLAILLLALVLPLRRAFDRPPSIASLEMLLLAVVFLVIYFVLPQGYGSIWYVDERAIEMYLLCLTLAALLLSDSLVKPSPLMARAPLLLAGLLAAGNLGALARHLLPDHAFLEHYRTVVDALPARARVLPVYTRDPEGALRPGLHAPELAVIDRQAHTPYLFSAEGGYPMVYFHDRLRLPAPDEMWYRMRGSLGGSQVTCAYDYLLATKPLQPERLPAGTLIRTNETASLYALDHAACAAAGAVTP